jgi:hypothetical protein
MATDKVELIIDPATGAVAFIHSDEAMALAAGLAGTPSIRRASHVEPVFGTTLWEADMAPSGGPTLGPFATRQQALDTEVAWLREHRLYCGGSEDGEGQA